MSREDTEGAHLKLNLPGVAVPDRLKGGKCLEHFKLRHQVNVPLSSRNSLPSVSEATKGE